MLILLKNAEIFSPDPLGTGCLLVGGGKILFVGKDDPGIDSRLPVETLDLEGAPLIPGLIDAHVHSTGGGGEGGFATQVPAGVLSAFTGAGVTSVVGLLGCDDETRTVGNLLARTRALREEGLSAWCWTGGYHVPPTTLTGSVRSDIVHIDAIIGLGEVAISDHRSSQPTHEELARLAADTHVAGMMSRKAGVMHLHLGDGENGLLPLRRLVEETELPAGMFHPTHVNRRKALFGEAMEMAEKGVTIDLTAVAPAGDDEWSAEDAWEQFIANGGDPARITVSSDSGGCIPVFDEVGSLIEMGVGSSQELLRWLAELHGRGHPLQDLLPPLTRNVSRLLRLEGKGNLEAGADADLVVLDEFLKPRHVMARGQWMVRDGIAVRKGRFEN